jgi:hypothetical protein
VELPPEHPAVDVVRRAVPVGQLAAAQRLVERRVAR